MYIEFTEEEKRRASEADLVCLLTRCGQTVKRVGSQYEWKDGDQTVSIISNLWFHHYEQVGGTTVGFVQKFMGMSYPDAVRFVLDEDVGIVHCKEVKQRPAIPKEFELPERYRNMNRIFAYLIHERGLDRDILRAFAHAGLLYESDYYHNVVFVGTDKTGKPTDLEHDFDEEHFVDLRTELSACEDERRQLLYSGGNSVMTEERLDEIYTTAYLG